MAGDGTPLGPALRRAQRVPHGASGPGEARVTLAFARIETTLIGRPLPATARHPRGHRQWWGAAGANYPHGWYGWQRVGWAVGAVDLATETVTFVRGPGAGVASA